MFDKIASLRMDDAYILFKAKCYIKVVRIIESLLRKRNTKFAIYPYGSDGKLVTSILKEKYNINPAYIFDNYLSGKEKNIFPISAIQKLDMENVIILLSSTNESVYSDLRYELMNYVKINQFIDVFSDSMFFDPEVLFDKPKYVTNPRFAALESTAKEIYKNNIEGSTAECGVYKGYFSNMISRFFPDRKLYLFDTFEGFDSRDIAVERESHYSDEGPQWESFLNDSSVEIALNNIGYRYNAIVRKGWFPETTVDLEDEQFAFVSLDTDVYNPIYAGLDFFYPRMSPGGVIFIHDFRIWDNKGVPTAVMNYCKKNKVSYVTIPDEVWTTAVIQKPI